MFQRNYKIVLASCVGLALAACGGPPSSPTSDAASTDAAALTLPVSLNEMMVGPVDEATYALFDVGNAVRNNTQLPSTDAEWREVRDNALQMIAMGKILQIPGTGPVDAQWTAAPSWKAWSERLSAVGLEMLQLARERNTVAFIDAGDQLLAACEGCHREFKPEIPTMNTYRRSSFPTPGEQ